MNIKDFKLEIREKGNEYVGIDIYNNELMVYLPIGYKINEDDNENKKEIRKFLKLLCKKAKYGEEYAEINFDFITSINILNNYYNYGIYKQEEKRRNINSKGRINWQRTIQKKQTYLNNKIIYNNLVNEFIDYKAEKEIQNIQEFCLNIISKYLGTILEFSYPKNICQYSQNEMIDILNKELKNTNQDIKIEMLTNLIKFIKNTNIKAIQNGNLKIKYKEFQYIYQDLIDCFGISKQEKKRFNPEAKYLKWSDDEEIHTYKMFPDTIVNSEKYNKIFIIDAKYKGTKIEDGKLIRFPNEYEIYKQVRYKDYLADVINEDKKIKNAFIIPKQLKNGKVEIADFYATIKYDEKENYEDRIYVVYVDTKSLILDREETMKEVLKKLAKR